MSLPYLTLCAVRDIGHVIEGPSNGQRKVLVTNFTLLAMDGSTRVVCSSCDATLLALTGDPEGHRRRHDAQALGEALLEEWGKR